MKDYRFKNIGIGIIEALDAIKIQSIGESYPKNRQIKSMFIQESLKELRQIRRDSIKRSDCFITDTWSQ